MGSSAFFFFWTFFSFSKLTQFRGVVIVISALVLDGVVVVAAFVIVSIFLITVYSLKIRKIQVFYLNGLPSAMVKLRERIKITIVVSLRIQALVLFVI